MFKTCVLQSLNDVLESLGDGLSEEVKMNLKLMIAFLNLVNSVTIFFEKS